jgi:hypothetical protein
VGEYGPNLLRRSDGEISTNELKPKIGPKLVIVMAAIAFAQFLLKGWKKQKLIEVRGMDRGLNFM